MQRALELAHLGLGNVSPNPLVGCVIVHDRKIIGEGYHKKYGEIHAEVNAINSVSDQKLLAESTAFVSLEPCAHFGKTPPCSELLIEKGIKKVVIACEDPFAEVDGKGIKQLRAAGLEVEVGLLKKDAIELNKRFFTFHQKKRPYIILKWAQTEDGFIARKNYDSKWISNQYSRQLVHKWRTEEDAILVGKNTALHDNPSLTAREWSGKNPLRILLDSNLEILNDFHLFNDDAKTLIFNSEKDENIGSNQWVKADLDASSIKKKLHELNIQSVIVEGGSQVLNSFIKENCWDEARVFTSSQTFEQGIESPKAKGMLVHDETILGDQLKIYRNQNGR